MAPPVSVAEYYAGKNIFITGVTGFVGKVIVEKLLRSCPRVGKIYMLIRSKHGKPVEERLTKLLNCPIFDNLRKSSPESLDKLRAVNGDVTVDALGLSEDVRNELINECNVVFHSAASVRFDLPLRAALDQNTKATKRVLELADAIRNLEVFVHVSTSYCQHENLILEEQLYPSVHSPQRIMDLVDWMHDDMLADIQPKLIHPHGNTYAFTKALSENLVSQYAGKFPIAIARLSIVVASWREPMPGWVDNLNGPTGALAAAGKGVLRTMVCHEERLVDGVPLDIAVNGCVLLAYLTALEKPQDVRICNVTQSGVNAKCWGPILKLGEDIILNELPFSQFLWVPGGSPKRSRAYHKFCAFFLHFIPALLVDLLLSLLGQKPFMMKVYNRVKYGINVLEYYTTKDWKFTNDYFRSLQNRISKEDDEQFYTDIGKLDWDEYMRNYVAGTQKYIFGEDPADRPKAKRLFNIVWCVDRVLTAVFYGLILYAVYKAIFVYTFN